MEELGWRCFYSKRPPLFNYPYEFGMINPEDTVRVPHDFEDGGHNVKCHSTNLGLEHIHFNIMIIVIINNDNFDHDYYHYQ